MGESLELLGYRVPEAADGQQALTVFEQRGKQADQDGRGDHLGRAVLVLSDIVMPEMGGQALLQALRRQDPDVKVVLMTGHPVEERNLKALRAQGLAGWLPKPPNLEQLALAVARALEKGRGAKEEKEGGVLS